MRSKYPAEDDAEIERLAEARHSVKEIATALGRSTSAMRSHMAGIGLPTSSKPYRVVTTPTVSRVRTLHEAGVADSIIATLVNRSPASVYKIRLTHGLRFSPPLTHRLSLMVTEHAHDALSDAGRRHGVIASTVARAVLELVTRKRAEMAVAVVAPPPVRASAPMSSMFATAPMSARM